MNREEIIKLAQEAEFPAANYPSLVSDQDWEALERFAALVADAERHECAKIVDGNADGCNGMTEQILRSNASAIRARGQA